MNQESEKLEFCAFCSITRDMMTYFLEEVMPMMEEYDIIGFKKQPSGEFDEVAKRSRSL